MHYTHLRAGVFDRPASGGVPAWTPLSLPNVRAWFRSGTGADFTDAPPGSVQATNGQAIRTRRDSVGAGSLTQATAGSRPLLDATGVPFADFDGVDDSLADAGSTVSYTQPTAAGLCVVWVGTPLANVTRFAERWGGIQPQWVVYRFQGEIRFVTKRGVLENVTIGETNPALGTRLLVIAEYVAADSVITIQVNGGPVRSTAAVDDWFAPVSIEDLSLSTINDGFSFYEGGQEELLICDPITENNRLELATYFGF